MNKSLSDVIIYLDNLYSESVNKNLSIDQRYNNYIAFCDSMESLWPRISEELKDVNEKLSYMDEAVALEKERRNDISKERDRYERESKVLRNAIEDSFDDGCECSFNSITYRKEYCSMHKLLDFALNHADKIREGEM